MLQKSIGHSLLKKVCSISFFYELYLPAVIDHKMFHVLREEHLQKHKADFCLLLEADFLENIEHCIMNHLG